MAEAHDDPLNPEHKLYTYENSKRPMQFPTASAVSVQQITAHIHKFIGPTDQVFHEIISDQVHLDVILVPPNQRFPEWTLVTSGMSDQPMKPPRRPGEQYHAELLIRLPSDWKMDQNSWKSDANYWPIRLLKFVARFPHKYGAFLWVGHTLDNGDPPSPWSKSTSFDAVFLAPSRTLPEEFENLEISAEKKIKFLAIYPVYTAESAVSRKEGSNALWKLFVDHEVSDVLNPQRKSLVAGDTPKRAKPSFWDRLRGQ